MSPSTESPKLGPTELTLFSVHTTDAVDNYCPATVRAEFRGVNEGFEKTLLTKILEVLPTLIPVLNAPDATDRIKHYCRALQLEDWRPNSHCDMLLNGRSAIERFFMEVPLLTDDEVKERCSSAANYSLSDLMQLTYNEQTFYFADQFAPDGSIHAECIECWRILKSDPSKHEWETALWWIYGNGWLGGPAPRDLFKEDPDLVLRAAQQEILKNEF